MVDNIKDIIKELQEYYGKELTEAQAAIYVRTLADLDITQLRQAADDIIKRGTPWFPKVAELRTAARRFTPLSTVVAENADYWRAMSMFNDSLAGRILEIDEKYEKFYPEVRDGASSK